MLSARVVKFLNKAGGLNNHKMNVKESLCFIAQGADKRGAESQVRHERSVHYVHVKPAGERRINFRGGFAKIGEVGGQDRR